MISAQCRAKFPLLESHQNSCSSIRLLLNSNGENMRHLQGKVAVVTGASKGIGAAIAKDLGTHGASVVVNYSSSKDGASKVVSEITAGGSKAIAVGGNIAKPEDIARIFAEAASVSAGDSRVHRGDGCHLYSIRLYVEGGRRIGASGGTHRAPDS
jgi:3-oxoacyl-ACP reductase-like protein